MTSNVLPALRASRVSPMHAMTFRPAFRLISTFAATVLSHSVLPLANTQRARTHTHSISQSSTNHGKASGAQSAQQ